MTRSNAGYSLLELLVVVAIMALVMTAGLPFAVRAMDGLGLETDARRTVARIRELRTAAMDLQQDMRLSVSPSRPSTLLSTDGRTLELSSGSGVRIEGGEPAGVLVLGWDGSVAGSVVIVRGTRQLRLRQRDAYAAVIVEAVP